MKLDKFHKKMEFMITFLMGYIRGTVGVEKLRDDGLEDMVRQLQNQIREAIYGKKESYCLSTYVLGVVTFACALWADHDGEHHSDCVWEDEDG